MIAEAVPDRPRRRNIFLLPVRFLLYWIIKALVLLFMGIRFVFGPRWVRYGLFVLIVGSGIAWKALGQPAMPWVQAAPPPEIVSTVAPGQVPPPPSVETYFKAQAAFDAKGMWDTMSDQLKLRMTAMSNTPDQLQKELDTAKQQGRSYASVVYVGGVGLGNGHTAYFYILTVDSPKGSSRLPYTFVLDQDGKLSSIQWSAGQ